MREIGANIANSLGPLALSGFILLVASPPKSVIGRVFDIVTLLLFGLSGPYCILLLPIALFVAVLRDYRWKWLTTGVVAVTSLVQGWGLLVLNSSGRVHYELGATPALFARILASQVYLAALIGGNSLGAKPGTRIFAFLLGLAIGGTVIVVTCFLNSGVEMKLLLSFSLIVFAASLISPMIPQQPGYSIWQLMSMAGGSHYWFFPTLAFAWSLLWCLNSQRTGLKITACYLLCFMPIAIARDWRQPARKDVEFAARARTFQTVPAGTEIEIPINPEGWTMQLVKH